MEESLHVSAALRTLLFYKRNLKGNNNLTSFHLLSGDWNFSVMQLFFYCVIIVLILLLKS